MIAEINESGAEITATGLAPAPSGPRPKLTRAAALRFLRAAVKAGPISPISQRCAYVVTVDNRAYFCACERSRVTLACNIPGACQFLTEHQALKVADSLAAYYGTARGVGRRWRMVRVLRLVLSSP